ncbi:spherulin-1A [Microthyrium microscopicum]|uniref:Spherulin-1A n=1 Tax=Microthyrium microscopicum TaxID=703497 RepID=A0A6A6TUZ1_9PEZI|nr:spherulin-1A [Microthyrium microscopicum]
MYTSSFVLPIALLASLVVAVPTPQQSAEPASKPKNGTINGTANDRSLVVQLKTAATDADRLALIPNDLDWLFDFQDPPSGSVTEGKGGRTVRADRLSFPPLTETGVSMTLGFLDGCGFNTPHTHPRATEINIVVDGRLVADFTTGQGEKVIVNTVEKFQMTVFPQGVLHTEFNPDCTPATFVAGFNNEDPGVQQAAQTLFALQDEVVRATLGNPEVIEGVDLEKFRSQIPPNVALGVEACLKKCGLQKRK